MYFPLAPFQPTKPESSFVTGCSLAISSTNGIATMQRYAGSSPIPLLDSSTRRCNSTTTTRLRPDPGKQFRSHHFVAHLAQSPLPTTTIYPSHLSRAQRIFECTIFTKLSHRDCPFCELVVVVVVEKKKDDDDDDNDDDDDDHYYYDDDDSTRRRNPRRPT